jgi:hypothetical protein
MDLVIPEIDFDPAQSLLLRTIEGFLKLEKMDLRTHHFRCYLGPGARQDIVIKELAYHNPEEFWPLVPNLLTAKRGGYSKFIHPKAGMSELAATKNGIICLTAATERYPENFLSQLLQYSPAAIFHLGG